VHTSALAGIYISDNVDEPMGWQVLAMFVGSLLEKQMVVICPNLVCYHSLSGICVFIVYKSICASRTAHNGGTIGIEVGPLVI
jgi:hypothetical protein